MKKLTQRTMFQRFLGELNELSTDTRSICTLITLLCTSMLILPSLESIVNIHYTFGTHYLMQCYCQTNEYTYITFVYGFKVFFIIRKFMVLYKSIIGNYSSSYNPKYNYNFYFLDLQFLQLLLYRTYHKCDTCKLYDPYINNMTLKYNKIVQLISTVL